MSNPRYDILDLLDEYERFVRFSPPAYSSGGKNKNRTRSRTPPLFRRRPRKPSAVVNTNGTQLGGKHVYCKTRKNAGKKKSLLARVKSLEKNKPTPSLFHLKSDNLYRITSLHTNGQAKAGIWIFTPYLDSTYGGHASDVLGYDYTTTIQGVMPDIKVERRFASYMLRNAGLSTALVTYGWFVCTDETQDGYATDYIEAYKTKVNSTTYPSGVAYIAPTATASAVPANIPLRLDLGQYMGLSFVEHAPNVHWKPLGQLCSTELAAGDTLKVAKSFKDIVFNYNDYASGWYSPGNIVFVFYTQGDLGHDVTNTSQVTYMPTAFDVQEKIRYTFRVPDGQGTKKWSNVTSISQTGVSAAPEQAHTTTEAVIQYTS